MRGCGLTTNFGRGDGIFGDGFYRTLRLLRSKSEAEGVARGEALDEVERDLLKNRQ